MTLQNIVDRVKRYLQSKRPATGDGTQFSQLTAQEAREQRTRSMTTLQQEVRQIQQEITDLSARQESGTAGANTAGAASANASRMETLQGDLARKQKELAKFQARV